MPNRELKTDVQGKSALGMICWTAAGRAITYNSLAAVQLSSSNFNFAPPLSSTPLCRLFVFATLLRHASASLSLPPTYPPYLPLVKKNTNVQRA